MLLVPAPSALLKIRLSPAPGLATGVQLLVVLHEPSPAAPVQVSVVAARAPLGAISCVAPNTAAAVSIAMALPRRRTRIIGRTGVVTDKPLTLPAARSPCILPSARTIETARTAF